MTKALIIIANPSPTSFSHAMAARTQQVLARHSCETTVHDLYLENFNPVQPTGEAGNTGSSDPLVEQHCADLTQADLILVFHPNWWSQPPAILKGWIDRVFRMGTAYAYPEGVGYDGLPQGLLKARCALVFNTSNTPEPRETQVFGDPLQTLWQTSVFALCDVTHFVRRMYSPISTSTPEQRNNWLAEVEQLVDVAVRTGV